MARGKKKNFWLLFAGVAGLGLWASSRAAKRGETEETAKATEPTGPYGRSLGPTPQTEAHDEPLSKDEQHVMDKLSAHVGAEFGGDQDAAFAHFDASGDKLLSPDELEDALEEIGVGNFATRGAWKRGVMDRLDKEPKDYMLTYDELMGTAG